MEVQKIKYSFKDCYELQKIDCNCNNCFFMDRDMDKYWKWHDWHKNIAEREFYNAKGKAILDAWSVIDTSLVELDIKSAVGMARVAFAMRFQFEKIGLLNYAKCTKFNKSVSFIPMTCQIETQKCFEHRKDKIVNKDVNNL